MSAFSLLVSPKSLTTLLLRPTEGSATFENSLSVPILSPLHFRRKKTRPVSSYAFLKGWLLPSLPPGCLHLLTSFLTKIGFGDLKVYSGLFHS
jgi:hypothetical protein